MEDQVDLSTPVTVGSGDGERRFTVAVLRELTCGQAIDAQRAAEVALPFRDPVTGKASAVCAISPTLATRERLIRQIARLVADDGSDMKGPLPPAVLNKLSEPDYDRLVAKAEEIDNLAIYAAAEALERTGQAPAGEPYPRGGAPTAAEMAEAADPRGRRDGDRGGGEGDAPPDRRAVPGVDAD